MFRKHLSWLGTVIVLAASVHTCPAQFLVDSYLGGSEYGNEPFRGMRGVTLSYQEVGGTFIPNRSGRLASVNVSAFVQPGTTGSARMTIFRYDLPSFGTSVTLGPNLGYAVTPQANYSGLVPFDFSNQTIQLTAGQVYAFMLSNPEATSFSGFNNSWRINDYTGTPRLYINSQSTYTGYNYFSYPLNYGAHFEVYVVPEPGSFGLLSILGAALLVWQRRNW